MKTTSTLIPLIFAASTYAHGILHRITINGQSFLGNGVDGGTPFPSVIRQVSTPNPNKGANNTALNCGPNALPATLIANANPGDQFGFDWKGADGSNVRIFAFCSMKITDHLLVASQYRPNAYIPSILRVDDL